MRQLLALNRTSGTATSSHESMQPRRPWSGLREGLELGLHCPHAPRAGSRRSHHSCSRWSSFADLVLPRPWTARSCRCGRPLDSCGHHLGSVRAGRCLDGSRVRVVGSASAEGLLIQPGEWWMNRDLKWWLMACLSTVAHTGGSGCHTRQRHPF